MQDFERWLKVNEASLTIQFAESGADREMDFDFEQEAYDVYVQCNGNNLHHRRFIDKYIDTADFDIVCTLAVLYFVIRTLVR